jgi:hypothetical protein
VLEMCARRLSSVSASPAWGAVGVGILWEEEIDADLLLLALERDVLLNNSFFAAEPVLQRSMDLTFLRCAAILEDLRRAPCSLTSGSGAWEGGG